MKYEDFSLVLMVTHACNLECGYCYTGRKSARSLDQATGRRAIDRAVASIEPGGTLELGFFGGEPLLRAADLVEWIDHADALTREANARLRLGLTTNGTIDAEAAWQLLLHPAMETCVSHDGLPTVHDRHRRYPSGLGSSDEALGTIRRLLDSGRDVRAVMVVRPDTVEQWPEGVAWLWNEGVRRFDATLDLWTDWSREDGRRLAEAVARCADFWASHLPECGISWFDEQAALAAGIQPTGTARCGFGDGEVAVAPSGRLYPCERLIGEDAPDNPMRLPGHVLQGDDFCRPRTLDGRTASCSACAIESRCNTICRCSNYVRTGDVAQPDGLLCLLNQVCCRETIRVPGSSDRS